MALVYLHPLPFGGEIWSDVTGRGDDAAIAPDLYRLGDSLEEWAAAIVEIVGSGRHTLVGNSIGGSCAIEIALLVPDRIERLVLVGTKPGHRPEPSLRDEALRTLSEQGVDAAFGRYWEPLFGPTTPPATIEAARVSAQGIDVDDLIRGVVAFHSRPDRSAFPDQWTGTVDVVAGEFETAPSLDTQRSVRWGNGRFHRIAGVGHYVPLEAPDALASIVGR